MDKSFTLFGKTLPTDYSMEILALIHLEYDVDGVPMTNDDYYIGTFDVHTNSFDLGNSKGNINLDVQEFLDSVVSWCYLKKSQ